MTSKLKINTDGDLITQTNDVVIKAIIIDDDIKYLIRCIVSDEYKMINSLLEFDKLMRWHDYVIDFIVDNDIPYDTETGKINYFGNTYNLNNFFECANLGYMLLERHALQKVGL